MSRLLKLATGVCVAAAVGWLEQSGALAQEAPAQDLGSVTAPAGALTLTAPDGSVAHIFPTVQGAGALARVHPTDTGPLLYHAGGSIMENMNIVDVYWRPAQLQNGGATGIPAEYMTILDALAQSYPGHAYGNNDTQYYQTISGTTTYIQNVGSFEGSSVVTTPYPASGCTDSATPGNCITDAQIRAELKSFIKANGLKAGPNTIFMVYTSYGEGSCFTSASTSCAYTQYCGYHGHFKIGTEEVIYANMPYANLSTCQAPSTPSPNSDADADAEASIASHEITESITDPLLNAWFTAQGNEIGDLCAYNYGTNTWDSGNANQFWPVTSIAFFELQQMFDNHKSSCQQLGP